MGKKGKMESAKKAEPSEEVRGLFGNSAKVDSGLAALFAAAPVSQSTIKPKAIEKVKQIVPETSKGTKKQSKKSKKNDPSSDSESAADEEDDEVLSSLSEAELDSDDESASEVEDAAQASELKVAVKTPGTVDEKTSKSRRKRKRDDEDLEAKYMEKLAEEEEREVAKRGEDRIAKRQKASHAFSERQAGSKDTATNGDQKMADVDSEDDEDLEIPQHESVSKDPDQEVEKANRTVFLGNVSSDAVTSKKAKKTLIQHMSSILESMPKSEGETHKVESIRFRSTAYTNMLPKKASFVTQDLMDSTTKSTNAYVVYSTKTAMRQALKLNGTVVLGRHLRVDSVAHPSKSDHKRCVFVGNLGFVDDESAIQAAETEEGKKKPRKKAPSDIEEGLWREFGKCGTVENVRVVRDSKTRVGKGIAYVQFVDENAVEAALLFDGKRLPPMLPRKLRVTRAKGVKRNATKKDTWSRPATNGVYNPKISEQQKSAMGRASKLLGRAGAAMINRPDAPAPNSRSPRASGELKAPESFVFEGHRATKASAAGGKKKAMKKMGRPQTKSAQRAKEWKYGGGGE